MDRATIRRESSPVLSDPISSADPAQSGSQGDHGHDEFGAALRTPPWLLDASPPTQRGTALPDGRRFAALSTLPEGLRLPPRRNVPLAKHLRQEAELPALPESPPATDSVPGSVPMLLPAAETRQLGFNCPACFAVLIIKDPATYHGSPAPCPTCGTRIQPPQCVPESPFSIVHRTAPVPMPMRWALEE